MVGTEGQRIHRDEEQVLDILLSNFPQDDIDHSDLITSELFLEDMMNLYESLYIFANIQKSKRTWSDVAYYLQICIDNCYTVMPDRMWGKFEQMVETWINRATMISGDRNYALEFKAILKPMILEHVESCHDDRIDLHRINFRLDLTDGMALDNIRQDVWIPHIDEEEIELGEE